MHDTSKRVQVIEYLAEMPAETPIAFGFHPNAEIGFKLREGDAFCNSLILLQPRDSSGARRPWPLCTSTSPLGRL
jgi:dynein heavy chain, axonemal